MGVTKDRITRLSMDRKIPLSGLFELSPVCNFDCKMCYVRKTQQEVNGLGGLKDAAWWIEIGRQAADLGLLYPLLSGGEPFLYPGFEDVYTAYQNLGVYLTINTNGSMLTEQRVRWMAKNPPLRLNITLYGAGPESYERLCGSGSAFERVLQGVHRLREYGIPYQFNCSVTPQNMQDLTGMIDIAREDHTPIQIATYMFPPIRREADSYGCNNRMTAQEAGHCKLVMARHQLDRLHFIQHAAYYAGFTPLDQIDFEHLEPGPGRTMRCKAGKNSFWINWRGKLSACGMTEESQVDLGKVRFAEAWQQVTDWTADIRYANVCTACPNLRICDVCQAHVLTETGKNGGRPVYYCEMMDAAAREFREALQEMGIDPAGVVEYLVEHRDCTL